MVLLIPLVWWYFWECISVPEFFSSLCPPPPQFPPYYWLQGSPGGLASISPRNGFLSICCHGQGNCRLWWLPRESARQWPAPLMAAANGRNRKTMWGCGTSSVEKWSSFTNEGSFAKQLHSSRLQDILNEVNGFALEQVDLELQQNLQLAWFSGGGWKRRRLDLCCPLQLWMLDWWQWEAKKGRDECVRL